MKVIRQTRSSVIVGCGGFVAAPGGIAARLLGKKLLVHEQNAVAGSTNRLLNKLAHQTLEAFPNTLPNACHVGNPIRAEIIALNNIELNKKRSSSTSSLNIMVMGGSLGAKAINETAPGAFACLLAEIKKTDALLTVNVWHQTGKGKHAGVNAFYTDNHISAQVTEFIDDIETAYRWADLVICRAGALTVSEVSIAGLPAIFIPFPYAIDDHQTKNAHWLVTNGAALTEQQSGLTARRLAELLTSLLQDEQRLICMGKKAKELSLPKATKQVADICEEVTYAN
jgi:UDP-N-acetylglucosamine--N-acetylmuramyl-(pentapeptide) pyrophosphoryl-undecaprenol N-acetylglucosamine transferase